MREPQHKRRMGHDRLLCNKNGSWTMAYEELPAAVIEMETPFSRREIKCGRS